MRRDQTILIVDDEADARNYFQMAVLCLGYSAEAAENGDEALACLEAHRGIALVLLDLRMPRRDGMETLSEMRQGRNATGDHGFGLGNHDEGGAGDESGRYGFSGEAGQPRRLDGRYSEALEDNQGVQKKEAASVRRIGWLRAG